MYLNIVDFSGKSFGIKAAAKEFFNTTPDSLNIEQSALLIGMLKATDRFNPVRNPENALNRRNTVIKQLEKYSFHISRI